VLGSFDGIVEAAGLGADDARLPSLGSAVKVLNGEVGVEDSPVGVELLLAGLVPLLEGAEPPVEPEEVDVGLGAESIDEVLLGWLEASVLDLGSRTSADIDSPHKLLAYGISLDKAFLPGNMPQPPPPLLRDA
jgi:hypothetical protein